MRSCRSGWHGYRTAVAAAYQCGRGARTEGVNATTYYRWERELLTGVRRNGAPPSTAVTFAELPVPKQVSCSVAERCATLHVGKASLDIYPGCRPHEGCSQTAKMVQGHRSHGALTG